MRRFSTYIMLTVLLAALLIPGAASAANKIYGAIALTGGGTGALDAIDGASLGDKDIAIVAVQGDKIYHYILNASSGASESSPSIISPDANAGNKRWILTGIYGLGTADSPTFTGLTLSGAMASLPVFTGASKELVSKSIADTKAALGLNFRVSRLVIADGTNADTIKARMDTTYTDNGEVVPSSGSYDDNIPKNGSSGRYALNGSGNGLTITTYKTVTAVLNVSIVYSGNTWTPATVGWLYKQSGGKIYIEFYTMNGNALDLTTITGECDLIILYTTSD